MGVAGAVAPVFLFSRVYNLITVTGSRCSFLQLGKNIRLNCSSRSCSL